MLYYFSYKHLQICQAAFILYLQIFYIHINLFRIAPYYRLLIFSQYVLNSLFIFLNIKKKWNYILTTFHVIFIRWKYKSILVQFNPMGVKNNDLPFFLFFPVLFASFAIEIRCACAQMHIQVKHIYIGIDRAGK